MVWQSMVPGNIREEMSMTAQPMFRIAALALALTAVAAGAQTTAPATDTTSATGSGEAAEATSYAPQKVVYHVNGDGGEGGKVYNAALANLRNHLDAVGDGEADLRVVMHGDGIGLLQMAADDMGMQGKITDLKNRGVRFLVCNNTLTGRDIDPNSLFDVYPEDIVPSGVAEIGKLQAEGFGYIKP